VPEKMRDPTHGAPIEIENLTKVYPNGFTALSDITLNASEGVFAFLGPNGSGKTTLLKILVGALRPTSGKVRILGYDLARVRKEIRKAIGYQAENAGLYEDLAAKEFLEYMGKLTGLNATAARNKAEEMLEWADLATRSNSRIKTFSSGMRQKLLFVQSLMGDPQILLLDEPTKGLDPVARERILKMIRQMASLGKTIVIATHLLPEVEYVATQVAIIDRGKIRLKDNLRTLTRNKDLASIYKDSFIQEEGTS